uniref:Reverse transcriptase RNase H-like domain-containing protein n=1 Tax=Chenopodium quinoa TaxID=63459 RepID=A0A803LHP5_CHEQI
MVKFFEENKASLAKIERYLGLGNDDLPPSTVRESVQLLSEQLNEMNGMIQNLVGKQREMFSPNGTPLYKEKEIEMEAELNYLREELSLIRKVVEEKTSSYSSEDRTKLWWRSRQEADRLARKDPIASWDVMKDEIRKQFLPNNTSWVARDKLKDLKHTNTIREYVKQFMSLMLDISNMSEEDKLFQFMSGLKPWAQTDLRRQKVQDLNAAIVAAEALVDWKPSGVVENKGGKKKGNDRGKKRKFGKRKGFKSGDKSGQKSDNKKEENSSNKKTRFTDGCFICKGPHIARNCPKRQQLSALLGESSSDEEDSREKEQEEDDVAPRMNTMKIVCAAIKGEQKEPVDGLMYYRVTVNGSDMWTMIDTGATHSFLKGGLVRKMGLKVQPSSHMINTVNSAAANSVGIVKDVSFKTGAWKGKVELLAVEMDDYELVLGNKFFKQAKLMVAPHLGGVMITDEAYPCFVPGRLSTANITSTDILLSAMQVKKGVKRGEPTFLAALVEIKKDVIVEVPDEIADLLKEFEGRKLKEAEEKYSAHEKEMLTVVHCLRTWRHYLLGTKFTVLTDNVANTFFQSQKTLSPKQARWMEFLEEYDFSWQHKPGRHNCVPDALSRKTQEVFVALTSVQSDFTQCIRDECKDNAEYVKLCELVKEDSVRRYWLENGLLLAQGGRLYVPSGKLRQELLRTWTQGWLDTSGLSDLGVSKGLWRAFVSGCLALAAKRRVGWEPASLQSVASQRHGTAKRCVAWTMVRFGEAMQHLATVALLRSNTTLGL